MKRRKTTPDATPLVKVPPERPLAGQLQRIMAMIRRRGTVCHQEVAAELELTIAAANLHFLELQKQGLIVSDRNVQNGRGRPTVHWKMEATANLLAGVFLDPPLLRMEG